MKPSLTGYLHPDYAQSLAEFGAPRHLMRSNGWILVSPIEDAAAFDARGCYPLFACQDWSGLVEDLENIRQELVSLVLVADPFGDFSPAVLSSCFPDLFTPYKEHFVCDLGYPMHEIISNHHLRSIRRAERLVEVEHCLHPQEYIQQWIDLYANLIKRHNIEGISAFSSESFSLQLRVPGLEMFRAVHQGQTIGMVLWYVQGEVGYYHLSAYSDIGYKLRASHVLFAYVIQHFKQSLHWLNLGAGAGVHSDGTDGLTRFKSGWSTGTRTAYLCGRIFNRAIYDELVRKRVICDETYFPAYRKQDMQ